jgi:hypothetical protein
MGRSVDQGIAGAMASVAVARWCSPVCNLDFYPLAVEMTPVRNDRRF